MAPQHEHEFEAQHGLPEPLPAGERILWQGAPCWRLLARDVFHVPLLAGYFAALLALRGALALHDGASAAEAARAVVALLPLPLFALATLLVLARLSARTTAYTLTDKRLVMRVGIVLTLTFNLPLKRLAGAALRLRGPRAASAQGDIALQLAAGEKIAYFHLWPHARPWRLARPEPMLRSLRDARSPARLLQRAWAEQTGGATAPLVGAAAGVAATGDLGAAQPA